LKLYLDASVIVPSLVDEPASKGVETLLSTTKGELQVGEFAAAEVASALSRLVRMDRLTAQEAGTLLSNFDVWRAARTGDVDLQASDVRLAALLVRRFELRLRTPDALHLATAKRIGAALVTLDGRLASAAREFGVVVEQPA